MKVICYECQAEIKVEETNNGFCKCWIGWCFNCGFSRDYYSEGDLIKEQKSLDEM